MGDLNYDRSAAVLFYAHEKQPVVDQGRNRSLPPFLPLRRRIHDLVLEGIELVASRNEDEAQTHGL